jgi:NAD+ kinase
VNDIVVRSAAGNTPLAVELLIDGGRGVAVACDGVLVSTPIGSSGYNLSAGGPLCSWRSAVFVVTALAPRSLAPRSLVLGPDDALTVRLAETSPAGLVEADGVAVARLGAGAPLRLAVQAAQATLAVLALASIADRSAAKLGWLR